MGPYSYCFVCTVLDQAIWQYWLVATFSWPETYGLLFIGWSKGLGFWEKTPYWDEQVWYNKTCSCTFRERSPFFYCFTCFILVYWSCKEYRYIYIVLPFIDDTDTNIQYKQYKPYIWKSNSNTKIQTGAESDLS